MEISENQSSMFGEEELMSSQEVSHARMLAKQTKTFKVNRGYAGKEPHSSGKCVELFGKSDPSMEFLKTWQIFLTLTEGKTLDQYSPNWPQWAEWDEPTTAYRAVKMADLLIEALNQPIDKQ